MCCAVFKGAEAAGGGGSLAGCHMAKCLYGSAGASIGSLAPTSAGQTRVGRVHECRGRLRHLPQQPRSAENPSTWQLRAMAGREAQTDFGRGCLTCGSSVDVAAILWIRGVEFGYERSFFLDFCFCSGC
mmetsp:Transcript_17539/g.38655  ORF Transcript_17539/g.38655 Transcript_17539/m.38655 type:complete len:129 (+) Transcript_17539:3299-3685(+)